MCSKIYKETNMAGQEVDRKQATNICMCVCVCINLDGGSFSLRVAAVGRMSHAHRAYACYRIMWLGWGRF